MCQGLAPAPKEGCEGREKPAGNPRVGLVSLPRGHAMDFCPLPPVLRAHLPGHFLALRNLGNCITAQARPRRPETKPAHILRQCCCRGQALDRDSHRDAPHLAELL